jgi:signal peptidase I
MRKKLWTFWREWVKPLLIIFAIMAPLRSVVADWNDVPSGSMRPTILVGDRIWINKLAYDLKVPFSTMRLSTWSDPQRGDIIVFRSPADGKRLVKRAVAVPGDLVELRDDHLFINGQSAEYGQVDNGVDATLVLSETVFGRTHPVMMEPRHQASGTFGPVRVPPGSYFAMGDNRDNSFDSRYFGFVPRNRIIGRATIVAMSFDRERHWQPRFDRFGRGLP